jgi:hypothetical protein
VATRGRGREAGRAHGWGVAAPGAPGQHAARPLPCAGASRAVHVAVPRLRLLARSLLPALPAVPAEPASPQSLMNIERPLLYFPSSIAEAEARHIVRRRRRPRRLFPESCSGRGQRSPGLGQEPVSRAGVRAGGEAKGAGATGRDTRRLGRVRTSDCGPAAGGGVCVAFGRRRPGGGFSLFTFLGGALGGRGVSWL